MTQSYKKEIMKLEECKICGKDVEYHSYGSPTWDTEIAPYDFPVCYRCIERIFTIGKESFEAKS